MAGPTLHYIHDPMCGWCYGAEPLVEAALRVPGLVLRMHGGGLFVGERRFRMSSAFRAHVLRNDPLIAELSGQPFGSAYLEGLLYDPTVLIDSEPPIRAVMAAERFDRAQAMFKRIQHGHYVEGRRVCEEEVLCALAADLGIPDEAYAAAFASTSGEPLRQHIAEARSLLDQVGGRGFPTFAIETGGKTLLLAHQHYYGRPADWQRLLCEHAALSGTAPDPSKHDRVDTASACRPDSCSVTDREST